MIEKGLWKKLLAELIGSFILVIAIVYPSIALRSIGIAEYLFIMYTAGIGLSIATWMFRDISGAQVNPVVTFGMMLMRKTSVVTGIFYWIAQFVGGLLAVLYSVESFKYAGSSFAQLSGYAVATPTQGYGNAQVILAEALGGFLLFAVYYAMTHVKDKVLAGLAIGFSLLVALVIAVPVSGGSLDPAREFAGVLLAKGFKGVYLWYFLVAPMIGAAVAALLYTVLEIPENWKPKIKVVSTTRSKSEE